MVQTQQGPPNLSSKYIQLGHSREWPFCYLVFEWR
nr:MAG TPA: hypothetical protein [Caudoviricetes sp.]